RFYHDIDKYSLSEIDNIITKLKHEYNYIQKNQTNFIAQNNLIPVVEGQIQYYEGLKSQLESQITFYEIEQATLLAYYDRHLTQIAYTGMLYPGMEYAGFTDWASSAWDTVKTGSKIITGSAFAAADYLSGKASETIFEVTDKAQAMYDHGVFSEEYNKWSNAYDQVGDGKSIKTIQNTFVDPLIATIKGDDKNGLGQNAVNNAQGTFKEVDKYLADKTGSNFVSQVALNTVTCGGYGLAKDLTTLNDANASTSDKIVAGAGVVLALAPIASGAKSANEGAKSGIKAASTTVSNSKNNIIKAINDSNVASDALESATQNLVKSTDDMVRAAGPNFQNADVLNSAFNSVATKFDDAVIQRVTASNNLLQAQQQVNSAVKNALVDVPKDTLTETVKGTVKTFISDHSLDAIKNRFQDLYQNSLTQVIKNSEPYIGGTIGNAVGIRDLTNFTISNWVNNNITGGITTLMTEILTDKNNDKPATIPTPAPLPVSTPIPTQVPIATPFPQNQPLVPVYPINPPYTAAQPMPTPIQQGYYTYPQQPIQPSNINPYLLYQYLQSQQQQQQNTSNYNPNVFDQLIGMQQQQQQQYDQSRGTINTNPNPYVPQDQQFTTDLSNQPGSNLTQHVQNLSQQTANMNPPKPGNTQCPQSQPTNAPSNPPSGIPIGDGKPEVNTTNGIDDDNDGVIDEGSSGGSCQIAIHDTGGDKDDQWELRVDNQSIGVNNEGKTRFWDLNLSKGQHQVSATGVKVPDNYGTYTIWFGTCSMVSGPPLTGSNLNQGTTFSWTINVP
ncbi:MAG: hypothetical protein AB1782_17725, partial [Cyanobacteriota bacterium]